MPKKSLGVILAIFCIPYVSIMKVINPPKSPREKFKEEIVEGNSTIYYVLEKYTNKNEELTQYVTFYSMKGRSYVNINNLLILYMNLGEMVNLNGGQTYGTIMLKNLDMYKLGQDINKFFGAPIKLLQIHKEALSV